MAARSRVGYRPSKHSHEHFAREELIWQESHYVDLAKHQQQHADLLHTVNDFKAKYEKGSASTTVEVMNFLRDWLTNRIMKVDKAAAQAIAR